MGMTVPDNPSLLTPSEAAEYLGISEATLKRWRGNGEGPPAVYLSARTIRYPRRLLEEWLRNSHTPTLSPTPTTGEPPEYDTE